ncbi:phosphoribosylformylglycinamidine synthase subunit PurQ [Candidatus Woesearchaeota archaeon]|nr:phosphoribosylformylglycinamidine synthase subunit PurQ [Candidatus Woesearchaeota archaeon]
MVKVYVVYGEGIGCHEEAAHAYRLAGAGIVELIHMRELLAGKDISDGQILNLSGGFLHGDILGAGMCAANEIEHAVVGDNGERLKELLLRFAQKGVIYGQCNGFQVLVRTGLLPGIDRDYSRQTATLAPNDCGSYFVSQVMHLVEQKKNHFAFDSIDFLYLPCRHGEGKVVFYSPHGSISAEDAEQNRARVNAEHVLLRYVHPETREQTQQFPYNPNGSIDAIAGLVDPTGHIFGHMAHPEAIVHPSRDPWWFHMKDELRRQGYSLRDIVEEGIALSIFRNVVEYVR